MGQQLALLAVGFVLTTVLGGLLGYVFQQRAWTHQFTVQRRTTEREAAFRALDELSTLLDKRRYRMLRIYWLLDEAPDDQFEDALVAYRGVLEEWNDGLNRRLALVATHFGVDMKRELEALYEKYRAAGQLLEREIRGRRSGETTRDREALATLLEELNVRNYSFAENGLAAIIAGRVGSDLAPDQRRATSTLPAA
jgi:hypothetical protein